MNHVQQCTNFRALNTARRVATLLLLRPPRLPPLATPTPLPLLLLLPVCGCPGALIPERQALASRLLIALLVYTT